MLHSVSWNDKDLCNLLELNQPLKACQAAFCCWLEVVKPWNITFCWPCVHVCFLSVLLCCFLMWLYSQDRSKPYATVSVTTYLFHSFWGTRCVQYSNHSEVHRKSQRKVSVHFPELVSVHWNLPDEVLLGYIQSLTWWSFWYLLVEVTRWDSADSLG